MRLVCFVGLILFVGACFAPEGEGPIGSPKTSKDEIQVLAALATAKEVDLVHQVDGDIIPANQLEIRAPLNGTITKVLVKEGQQITAGTSVASYDVEFMRTKLELAQAEEEEANAAIEYDQYRLDKRDDLLDEEEISTVVYDMLEKKLDYEKTRANRAKAEVAYLQKVERQSDIASPIGGVVTTRMVAEGMPVVEGQTLMEVVQIDPVKVRMRLPEELIPSTHKGQLLTIRFPRFPLPDVTTKISELGVDVDPLTRTFEVTAKLDNREGKMKVGMAVEVTVQTDRKSQIIAIPKRSVTLRDGKAVVFKIVDDVAKRVLVRLGETYQNEVSVLKGIEPGDVVVLDPPPELNHDKKVTIQTAAPGEG